MRTQPTKVNRLHRTTLVLAGTILLNACGSADPTEPQPAVPSITGTTTPTPADSTAQIPVAPANTSANTAANDQTAFAQAALKSINQARASGRQCGNTFYPSVPALKWNNAVTEAARLESVWLQTNNAFTHVWPNGVGPAERLSMAQYAWSTYGENIAAGQPGIDEVMSAWIASPGHCANIMHAGVVDVGVAKVDGTASNSYPNYWTLLVAKGS
jgi:uncharacterized protein YkwD